MSKKVVKPHQWMCEIGVGYMGPSWQEEGSKDIFVFNNKEAGIAVRFLNICSHWGWSDYDHYVTRVFDSPPRYVVRVKGE